MYTDNTTISQEEENTMKLLKSIVVCGLLLTALPAWGQSIIFACSECKPYADPAVEGGGAVPCLDMWGHPNN